MAELEIHFTEFFSGETVAVSRNARELFRGEGLKTDPRKSLAKIARIDAPPGQSTLHFDMLTKSLSADLVIDASLVHHVSISFLKGELRVIAISKEDFKREPRGYL